jgi:uncharacterized protein (DUF2336 family)
MPPIIGNFEHKLKRALRQVHIGYPVSRGIRQTMQKASGASQRLEQLVELARDNSGASRANLFNSLTQLYERDLSQITLSERVLMREIMRRLIHQVEMRVRLSLAERLAEDPSAPHDLILLLANDRIEVATLVLERSHALTEEDLIDIVHRTTPAHQRIVATRPDVTEAVADALAASTADDVIEVLLRNVSARISRATFETIADRAKANSNLQYTLLHRPGVPASAAAKLYGHVSDALKTFITRHFEIDPVKLSQSLELATGAAAKGLEVSAQRLVDKLYAAGQLKPGFLIKSLHQGQSDLFEWAFAKLLGISVEDARILVYRRTPATLAIACRAIGIDRSVFATIFNYTRMSSSQSLTLSAQDRTETDRVFQSVTPQAARERVRVGLAA